ncbi:D-Ala-D-Ala carboxypeptidase family metallohydrolase [bacterium]|nr:D-Ala-D-Ala carboxypeptidase family metallohydrolase [bacterium]MDB4541728.1 D-Ala-D-Ala carboxypeptidase family metallohydrolase [bacterium]
MTKNFSKEEFDCNDGSEMPINIYHNMVKVANQLQTLRNYIGKPIQVNSAYRSEEYNASIGGVKNSQHIMGRAADIVIKGMTPIEVSKVIEELIDKGDILQGGIGIYSSFVHYDIRGNKARWDYSKK